MAQKRGNEIPTIDCARITVQAVGSEEELVLDTASNIAVEPQIETQEPIRLIIKQKLRAQKPQQSTLVGNQITLTDNVFIPELVQLLQGGEIVKDEVTGRIISYTPPVAGSEEKGSVLTLNAYSSIYNAAGVITGYEKISYPNCQGTPIAMSAEDDVFRVSTYTINSAPDIGQAPYTIQYILPEDLPPLPTPIIPEAPAITTLSPITGAVMGEAFTTTIAATGSQPIVFTLTSGALPAGLTLAEGGIISGTPTESGDFTFTITAANGVLPNSVKVFQMTVAEE